MTDQKKLLATIKKSVVEYRVNDCKAAVLKTLDHGVDPTIAVMEGLTKGMERASVLYDTNQYFVLKVLMCAEAL